MYKTYGNVATTPRLMMSEIMLWIIKLLHIYCHKQDFLVRQYILGTLKTVKHEFYHDFPENY